MTPQRAHIFGTGLIGASVGLGLRRAGWETAGWDPSSLALETAFERGALGERLEGPTTSDADLVVLAAPPSVVLSQLRALDTDVLVTDVAGVKGPVVEAANHLAHFVGGHPMAGSETSGPRLASPSMFHGATWVLTNDRVSTEDLDQVSSFVEDLGANPVVMSADAHDLAVAKVSHLPHVLAASLMNLAHTGVEKLAGGGFRDLTRVAAGETDLWLDILLTNNEALRAAITELQLELNVFMAGDSETIRPKLETGRDRRLTLGEHDSQIEVILLDEPGEIARVGHALEASRVDVRDLQLRHGEHGGGGVLTISVKADGRQPLMDALSAEGFEVRDE